MPMPLSVTAKGKANATTRQAARGDLKGDLAPPGKLHGVVDQVLKRGPQAHRIADRLLRQVDGEINPTGEPGRLRACREARRRRLRKRPRIKGIGPQREIVSLVFTASTTSVVRASKCRALLVRAATQRRSRSPRSDAESRSAAARIPVSGVRTSWASPATISSNARTRLADGLAVVLRPICGYQRAHARASPRSFSP